MLSYHMKDRLRPFLPQPLIRLRRWYKRTLFPDTYSLERVDREYFFRRAFHALSFNGISGDYCEFGCSGMTFSLAYRYFRESGRVGRMWAFDSFEGLPPGKGREDEHPVFTHGHLRTGLERFIKTCKREGILDSNYRVVPGYYEETLKQDSPRTTSLPDDVALAYVDCDLYSSARTVLSFLSKRLKHGMIIAFDDYYCWSNSAVAGERLAALEFFNQNLRFHFLPYIQYSWAGMSFVVEDRKYLPSSFAQPAQRF